MRKRPLMFWTIVFVSVIAAWAILSLMAGEHRHKTNELQALRQIEAARVIQADEAAKPRPEEPILVGGPG